MSDKDWDMLHGPLDRRSNEQDIEARVKPIFPLWIVVAFVAAIGFLGLFGLIEVIMQFRGE